MTETSALRMIAQDLVAREAAAIDRGDWAAWLALMAPNVEFWAPAWKDDGALTTDPRTQLSLMYYRDRTGLEDRVERIVSGRSAASVPLARTCHMFSLLEAYQRPDGRLSFTTNWTTHLAWQGGRLQTNFGSAEYTAEHSGDAYTIVRKKIVLLNDIVDTVIDIYSI